MTADPRVPQCRHDWDNIMPKRGERQRECPHCHRWIWDHEYARFESVEAGMLKLAADGYLVATKDENGAYRFSPGPRFNEVPTGR
jgi:hypothetical protein